MRKAFHEKTGPLTDQSLPTAEREGFSHLFAGAIGAFKNPHSHRKVVIDDLRAAQRQLLLASQLLYIVDAAKARASTKP
jgi:phosphatidylserine/phosphatidylglycerophosphate/cardiolipin synthase-like enzyme